MTTIKSIKAEIASNTKSLSASGDSNAHNTAQSMANKSYGPSWRQSYAPAGTTLTGAKSGGPKSSKHC